MLRERAMGACGVGCGVWRLGREKYVTRKEVSLSHRGARMRVGLSLGALRRDRFGARQERARFLLEPRLLGVWGFEFTILGFG